MTQIIVPRRTDDWFRDGVFTLRAYRYFEDISSQVNTTTDEVTAIAPSQSLSSQVQWLQQQIDGLPEFTIDTTGFTADLTFITADKVIA
jgi:hypothetical protein